MPPKGAVWVSERAEMKQRFPSWRFGVVGDNIEAMNTPTTPNDTWAQAKTDAIIKQALLALSQRFLLLARCAK